MQAQVLDYVLPGVRKHPMAANQLDRRRRKTIVVYLNGVSAALAMVSTAVMLKKSILTFADVANLMMSQFDDIFQDEFEAVTTYYDRIFIQRSKLEGFWKKKWSTKYFSFNSYLAPPAVLFFFFFWNITWPKRPSLDLQYWENQSVQWKKCKKTHF